MKALETSTPSASSSLHYLVLHLVLPVLLVFSVLPVLVSGLTSHCHGSDVTRTTEEESRSSPK